MKSFVSQTGLSKRIGISPNTLSVRLRTHGVEPDGVLLVPTKPDVLLFNVERLNSLRATLTQHKPVEANIQ